MSCESFDDQMMQGVYALGRQRDNEASGRRELARRLRRERVLAKLTAASRRLDFGMVFFSAVGTLPLIMLAGRTTPADWPMAAICTVLLLTGTVLAWQGRKIRARMEGFQRRLGTSAK